MITENIKMEKLKYCSKCLIKFEQLEHKKKGECYQCGKINDEFQGVIRIQFTRNAELSSMCFSTKKEAFQYILDNKLEIDKSIIVYWNGINAEVIEMDKRITRRMIYKRLNKITEDNYNWADGEDNYNKEETEREEKELNKVLTNLWRVKK